MRHTDLAKARSFLPTQLSDFSCVDANGARGSLLTVWNPRTLRMTSFIKQQCTLTTFFTSTASDLEFALTNVYAPANHRDSLGFLEDLAEVASHVPACWALAGNFNLTRGADENINGNVHQHLADAFNDSIHFLGLIDLPLLDRLFT